MLEELGRAERRAIEDLEADAAGRRQAPRGKLKPEIQYAEPTTTPTTAMNTVANPTSCLAESDAPSFLRCARRVSRFTG